MIVARLHVDARMCVARAPHLSSPPLLGRLVAAAVTSPARPRPLEATLPPPVMEIEAELAVTETGTGTGTRPGRPTRCRGCCSRTEHVRLFGLAPAAALAAQ